MGKNVQEHCGSAVSCLRILFLCPKGNNTGCVTLFLVLLVPVLITHIWCHAGKWPPLCHSITATFCVHKKQDAILAQRYWTWISALINLSSDFIQPKFSQNPRLSSPKASQGILDVDHLTVGLHPPSVMSCSFFRQYMPPFQGEGVSKHCPDSINAVGINVAIIYGGYPCMERP